MNVCVYVCMNVCVYVCMVVCMNVYVCMYACIYLCVCMYVCMNAVELGGVGACHQRLWIRDRETSMAGVYVHT